ncbi:hemin uptake protein HemP [Nitrobacter sp.]|uniref:hemin uptake protein HemP n=1 Tax=unclassified Nitrobacter TaxID=2620411 RepID=UPI00321FA392
MPEISRKKHQALKNDEATVLVGERSITMREGMLDSKELFSDGREVIIAHGAENYRLRLTSQNKLILTK